MSHNSGGLGDILGGLGDVDPNFELPLRHLERAEELPDREQGKAMSDQLAKGIPFEELVIECSTSRRPGFTHVLWVDAGAADSLGPESFGQLAGAVGAMPGATGAEWENPETLHVVAPGRTWDQVLAAARRAVAELLDA